MKKFEDAWKIEEFVKNGRIKVKKIVTSEGIEMLGLGKGEKSSLELHHKIKSDFVVSDDQKFLNELEKRNISFLTPPAIMYFLCHQNKMSKTEGLITLEKMKPFIKLEVFTLIKKQLEELK